MHAFVKFTYIHTLAMASPCIIGQLFEARSSLKITVFSAPQATI